MEKLLDWEKTALVVIDLQKGIVGYDTKPYAATDVVNRAASLAGAFREKGAFVVLVRVSSKDGKDMLHPKLDQQPPQPSARPADWAEIVSEIGAKDSDLLLTKRQWGAFHGTELDLQLRRRGIDTIVLCGIATGIGVDTTAREAFQLGYNQVFAEDAMSGITEEEHNYVVKTILPRIGRVRTTEQILQSAGE
ncbi:hydrolase [Cohnella zeiphila]|uniref:Hydrolase n=1 Tax=Cohnella zeiphila TaxID=2761120 RepID=A0A7X0SI44_9BACL|nr:hydrolase [Cohnella zeiphila]MBB6730415.1 hydrolase [Cohnella zeiphila]